MTAADRELDPTYVAYGPCCSCGEVRDLPNLVMLAQRGPTPGKGWGCLVCGLEPDGAMAAICAQCIGDAVPGRGELPPIRTVCAGYVVEPERVPRENLERAVFDHDGAKHRELAPFELDAVDGEYAADDDWSDA